MYEWVIMGWGQWKSGFGKVEAENEAEAQIKAEAKLREMGEAWVAEWNRRGRRVVKWAVVK